MFKKILSIFIFQLILVNSIALSKVIYDKNGILITDYETEVFKKIYSQDIQRNISTAEAIKEYVLVTKIVSQVVSKNPDLINLIDNNLLSQIGEKNFENQIIKNYFRYKKIKNLYISQYIKDQFDIDELRESLNEFKELNIPISKNNCNTYDQFYNFKDNNDFFVFLLEKFKNDTNDFVFTIVNLIDNNLLSQIGEKNFENQIIKNYFRYKKIKNLYISQYIKDQFDIDELRESLNEFKELNIPISKNNCNTYDQFYNFKDNNDFFVFLLEKFKNDTNDFVFTIEGITYQACIDDAILNSLQSNIYLYLNQKILSIIRSSIQR